MPQKPKNKMPVTDRAKQFMPFSALRGLSEALAAKEKIVVPKITLSPEMEEELNYTMQELSKGDLITIVYYCNEEYLKQTGILARIDPTAQLLQVVNTKIAFEDILSITREAPTP